LVFISGIASAGFAELLEVYLAEPLEKATPPIVNASEGIVATVVTSTEAVDGQPELMQPTPEF